MLSAVFRDMTPLSTLPLRQEVCLDLEDLPSLKNPPLFLHFRSGVMEPTLSAETFLCSLRRGVQKKLGRFELGYLNCWITFSMLI